jgi:hypothetical protein
MPEYYSPMDLGLKEVTQYIARRFPDVKIPTVKRYLIFIVTTMLVFASAYYALMDQSIKYSNAINAEYQNILDNHQKNGGQGPPPKRPTPEPPAGWLYLGDGDILERSKTEHDVLSALYFSLSVQSTLGPPHYPPNKAWKLLTGVHILFVLAAAVLAIV